MKKKLFFVATLVFIACAFVACKNCKTCKQVTYVDGVYDHENAGQEYCDANLLTVEAIPDVTINNTTTKWECN